MSPIFTLLTITLSAVGFLMVPSHVLGQAPTNDTVTQAAADSQPAAAADTAPKSDSARATSDSVVQRSSGNSSSRADSLRPASDSGGQPASSGTKAPATVTPASPPTDSILIAACSSGGSVARDLLVTVFAPEAGPEDRTAAAKEVGGTLLGPVSGEPGSYYLRVPSGGDESRLRAAADQLALLSQVRQVGSRACPSTNAPVKPSS